MARGAIALSAALLACGAEGRLLVQERQRPDQALGPQNPDAQSQEIRKYLTRLEYDCKNAEHIGTKDTDGGYVMCMDEVEEHAHGRQPAGGQTWPHSLHKEPEDVYVACPSLCDPALSPPGVRGLVSCAHLPCPLCRP